MSHIAYGFVTTGAIIAEAALLRSARDFEGAWETLEPYEFDDFGWSGEVISVLCVWLEERGIEIRLSSSPFARSFIAEFLPLICMEQAETVTLMAKLEQLHPASEELATSWRKSTGHDSPEAQQFMIDGWNWLLRLLRAGSTGEWCILRVA